jgi:NitT/TauT family transport system substrate-binding protein
MKLPYAAIAAAFGLIAALVAPAAQAQQKDKVVLLLNWYNYGEHAPFYLGIDQGLYAKENIDLEIQEGRGSGVTVQAVGAGSATFGYADVSTMIKAAAKGAPVIAVGILLQKSPMSAMGFDEKKIQKPADVVGKTVAVTPGDSLSQIWPVFLKVNKIEPGQLKQVTGDAITKRNAVVNGQADLLLGNVNDQLPTIEETTGKPMKALLFADHGVNTVNAGIIVQKEMQQKNPDLIKRFMRASTAAVEASEKSPEAAVKAMLKINPKAGKEETVAKSLALTLPLYHTAENKNGKPFRIDEAEVAKTIDMLVEYTGMDAATKGKASDYYTPAFLP